MGVEAVNEQTGSEQEGAAAGGEEPMESGAIQNVRWRSGVERLDKILACAAWCKPV